MTNLLAALLLTAAPPAAPAVPPPASGSVSAPIVVEGRTRATVRDYVDSVGRPEQGRQAARWDKPLCLTFSGVGPQAAGFIRARVAAEATAVTLPMGGSHCQANAVVALVAGSDQITHDLVHMTHRMVGDVTNDALLPPREIDALEAPHTVRWLTASATRRTGAASLIHAGSEAVVLSKIILIDEARVGGVTLDQLADYVAFVTLASPDIAGAFAGSDSIMALFTADPHPPARMTGQDHAFLHVLYTMDPDRDPRDQRGLLRHRVGQALASTPPP